MRDNETYDSRLRLRDLLRADLARLYLAKNSGKRGGAAAAIYKLGEKVEKLSRYQAGGISAPIDIETGELGKATDVGAMVGRGWLDRHPDNGARRFARKSLRARAGPISHSHA
jgi:hypothetical protein